MIRRLRVALKHSSPAYEDVQRSSSLMPSLLGAPTTNRQRLVFLLLCFAFLYFWNRREASYADEIRKRDEQLVAVRQEYASVLEKLRVIYMHKKKIESESLAHKFELEKFNSKLKLKESEVYGYRTKNEQCKRELESCNKNGGDGHGEQKEQKVNEGDENLKREVSDLKTKIEELNRKLEETENNSNSMSAILKDELKQCETKIRQLTGGGAIEHYSQNETAHFQRAQKANEPLFFDRGNIQHHVPDRLLMGKQLAETLEQVKVKKLAEREQLNKHPDDRENQDHEVNEQPNQEEQDYKEH